MARFNELLAGRFNEGISSVLGIAEQEGVKTVAPELMPVYQVEREKPEHAFPKQERLAFGYGSQAAGGAGTYAQFGVYNPVGSQLLVCVDLLVLGSAAGEALKIGPAIPTAAQIAAFVDASSQTRDTRWGDDAVARPAARAVTFTSTVNNGSFNVRVPNGTPILLPIEWVLHPGWGFFVASAALVTALDGQSALWRERKMLPEEDA